MYRLRRSLRRAVWIIGALLVMATATLVGALVATTPRFFTGASTATLAAQTLLSNPQQAALQFRAASVDFDASLASLRALPEPAQFPSLIPPFSWYIHLNKAAVYLGRAGQEAADLAAAYPAIQSGDDPSSLLAAHSAAVSQLVTKQKASFDQLTYNLKQADTELSRVPDWVLLNKRGELLQLKQQVHHLSTAVPHATAFITALRHALGSDDHDPHTALIIFQNNDELRASGGFMGSYAVVTGSGGDIRSFNLGTDVYKLDKALMVKESINPPPELQTIIPLWGFRDSNVGEGFLPDLGTQVADFYSKASGVKPDLILFTDLSILQDVLALTGPVALPGTTTVLDHSSVSTALTTYIEKDYWDSDANKAANEPKSIIGDLIPVIIGTLRGHPNALHGLPGLISAATERKSLQLWSSDDSLVTASAPLFPTDTPPSGDWLKIVNNNLGGKKSSSNVYQDVVITDQGKSGERDRTVTITRTHHGKGIWPDDENHNYTEVYLPPTAEIIQNPTGKGGENLMPQAVQAAYGLVGVTWPGEVKRTDQWVRVGFWSTTSVAEQTQYVLKYRLPDENAKGPFLYLKQAGAANERLKAFKYDGNVTGNLALDKYHFFW